MPYLKVDFGGPGGEVASPYSVRQIAYATGEKTLITPQPADAFPEPPSTLGLPTYPSEPQLQHRTVAPAEEMSAAPPNTRGSADQGAGEGCQSAWSLVEKFRPFIKAKAKALSISSGVPAEDLEQQAYLAILEETKDGRTVSVKNYARYAMLEFIRTEATASRKSPVAVQEVAACQEEDIQNRQISEQLACCMTNLPDKQREVIQMNYVESISLSAIAQKLNVSLSTVNSRHAKALASMRRMLQAAGLRHHHDALFHNSPPAKPAGSHGTGTE
jgi:RNA polymerase sigma factor (sigma-70 family)